MKITIGQPGCIQELGKRENQEDSVFPIKGSATSKDKLFILCDGMGGHERGEIASRLVCDSISEYIQTSWDGAFFDDKILQKALDEAEVRLNRLDTDSQRKPGTTMVLLCLHRGGVLGAHIGDSRIYHIRPSANQILYKSRDHSLVYDLFLSGEITKDEMKSYPKRNVLSRALLPNQERKPKVDIVHISDVCPDDYFVLCSDGIFENVSDQDLLRLVKSDLTMEEKCQELILRTNNNADNHSAYIIRVEDVEKEKGDHLFLGDESNVRFNAVLLEKAQSVEGHSLLKKFVGRIMCWRK